MTRHLRALKGVVWLLVAMSASPATMAQKQGGVLRQYIIDSPASMSIHEETTVVAERPMMAVMNNLVLFDQHIAQNSLADIVPELATDWAWDEDGTRLLFHLRQSVKWHDDKPFTAADVKCTWDLVQGKSAEKLRVNPRKAWLERWFHPLHALGSRRFLRDDCIRKTVEFLSLYADRLLSVPPRSRVADQPGGGPPPHQRIQGLQPVRGDDHPHGRKSGPP